MQKRIHKKRKLYNTNKLYNTILEKIEYLNKIKASRDVLSIILEKIPEFVLQFWVVIRLRTEFCKIYLQNND